MLKLSDDNRSAFAEAVAMARRTPEIRSAVAELYAAFESERSVRAPVCDRSGKCCRFEEYGHRLFVTTIEVAWFADGVDASGSVGVEAWDGTGCRYQVGGLCSAHTARPFGCRIYFCDPTATRWQQDQYEAFHARFRELHDRLGVPYWYVEWREALSAVGLGEVAPGRATSLRVLGGSAG